MSDREDDRTVAEPATGRIPASRTSRSMQPEPAMGVGSNPSMGGTVPMSGAALPDPRAYATNLRLFEVIGRGGMGVIYRGEQVELGREVAFKRLLETDSDVMRERFLREARITAQLDHPNVVPVHLLDVPEGPGPIGYAMKLVQGKTLRTLLAEAVEMVQANKPLDEEHALATRLEHFLKICDAMAFAHAQGILHRDLKPANLMVGLFGEVYVMDWGVARPMGDLTMDVAPGSELPPMPHQIEPGLTQVGEIVGSPAYMSPEQAEGNNDQLDGRSDQYALGLILYELVSLNRAIEADTNLELFTMAARGEKRPLVHLGRERIAPELAAIVDRATSKTAELRYPDVQTLADDVRRYLRGEAVHALPEGPIGKLWRVMSRHKQASLAVLFALLAVAAVAVGVTLVQKSRGELALKAQGERRTALYVDVAAQGRLIDADFQRMEEGLEGLRTAAMWALSAPEPGESEAPFYFDTDFRKPESRPSDFTKETAYRWPVSMDHPVVGVAPGTDRGAITSKLRRLSPLRHHMREMFLAAGEKVAADMSVGEQNAFLLARHSPIDYAYVATPEGIHFMLPGMDALPPDYDVRTAGFYTMSANKHGRRWGSPYIDSTTDEQGDDLVLPCTQGIWSKSGIFLGVAGVEITVTKLIETRMRVLGRQTIRTSLLTADGKKVIDSNDAGKRFEASGKDEGMALYDFDIPEVVAGIRAKEQGLRDVRRDGRDAIAVFVKLDVVGWYFVVEVDKASLGKPPGAAPAKGP